jgi:hypothetical protein
MSASPRNSGSGSKNLSRIMAEADQTAAKHLCSSQLLHLPLSYRSQIPLLIAARRRQPRRRPGPRHCGPPRRQACAQQCVMWSITLVQAIDCRGLGFRQAKHIQSLTPRSGPKKGKSAQGTGRQPARDKQDLSEIGADDALDMLPLRTPRSSSCVGHSHLECVRRSATPARSHIRTSNLQPPRNSPRRSLLSSTRGTRAKPNTTRRL